MRFASLLVVPALIHPPTAFLAYRNITRTSITFFRMYVMDQFVLMAIMQIQAVGFALNANLIVQPAHQAHV